MPTKQFIEGRLIIEDKYSSSEHSRHQNKDSPIKAILFSVLGSFCFAFCNSLQSILSSKYGPRGVTTYWIGGVLCFVIFHFLNSKFNFEKGAGFHIYYVSGQHSVNTLSGPRLDKAKMCFLFLRAVCSLTSLCLLGITFYYTS